MTSLADLSNKAIFRECVDTIQKHPHGRGEDPDGYKLESLERETPPRAWGRP